MTWWGARRALVVGGLLVVLSGADCNVEEPLPERFMGQDPSVRAAGGEARAGVIRDDVGDALFGGIGAEGQSGDVKIYNPHVQFIVSNVGRRHGWVDVGGTVVDADLVRPVGEPGEDALDDAYLSFGLFRLYEAETVEIVADGSTGGAALVRTTGRDVPWDAFVQGLESPDITGEDLTLEIVREFELAPDSDSLRVTTTYTNTGDAAIEVRSNEGFQSSKEDFQPWFGEHGMHDAVSGEIPSGGYVGRHGEAVFSIWPEDTGFRVSSTTAVVSIAAIVAFNPDAVELAPGGSDTRTVHYTLAKDTLGADASRRAQQGEALGTVRGLVSDELTGEPVVGARVHFSDTAEDDARVLGYALTGDDGSYEARLPPGDWLAWLVARHPEQRVDLPSIRGRYAPAGADSVNAAYLADVTGAGEPTPQPFAGGRLTGPPTTVAVTAESEATLDLAAPPAGQLRVLIEDDSGAAIGAVVRIDEASGVAPESPVPDGLREALGLPDRSVRTGWLWTADGDATIAVPPGTYSVEAGHSWRHERVTATDVEVPEGGIGEVTITLAEVIARDGWYAADTHLHAAPSMDGRLSMEDRLVACAAVGLEVPVTTDHDRYADYGPLATAMGLDEQMTVMSGGEVTTIVRGHFNLFPVEVQPQSTPNLGALRWWDRDQTTTDDLLARTRATGTPDSLLQVNHGRLVLGMMSAGAYAAFEGEPARPTMWSWDFDLVEIVTHDTITDWRENRTDFFSFLELGMTTVPTGSSDSHDLKRPCALGRTDVYLGDDVADPGDVTVEAVREAIVAGRVVVSSAVTLRATLDAGAGPIGPGETTTGDGGDLAISVRGPSWVQPEILRVWRNREVIHEEELAPGVDGVIADFVLPVEATEDSWFVVEVDGGEPLGGTWGGHEPYALTNALRLDVEGDGWAR